MDKVLVLVGNPNVGKSIIFNRLTGRYAVVSNYPGTTVDVSRGTAGIGGQPFHVIDTPGTNSLIPSSEDEQVTRDVLFREKVDVIVQVADEKNLLRSLHLTLELLELGIPMVLALNMHDEAIERGITVDRQHLQRILGIPVVETVGLTGEGMGELKKQVLNARPGTAGLRYGPAVERFIDGTAHYVSGGISAPRALSLMLLSEEPGAWKYVAGDFKRELRERLDAVIAEFVTHPRLIVFNARNARAVEIVDEALTSAAPAGTSRLERLGVLAMRPFPGYLIVAVVLWLMYEFVGVFAAGYLVDLLEHRLFGGIINPALAAGIGHFALPQLVRDFLVGPYGMFTMALTYALAIVFPIVGAFFLFFGLLEDSGYLPRLSVMLDRAFRQIGLNGKAVLPMVLGLGCGTMAAIGSRILETRKERFLVILLLSLTIPCSAQLGVILGLLAGLSWKVTALWLASILGSLLLVGGIASRIVPGEKSPFILEIPPLRRPLLVNILQKVKMRLAWYFKEAVPLFMIGTAILFIADKSRVLGLAERAASPVIVSFLGLPKEVTQSFIIGFLRRDYGAAGLFVLAQQGMLSARQILVSAVAITLFVPCIAQCFMVVREQGWKAATAIIVFVLGYAFLYSGLLNYLVGYLGLL